MLPSAKLRLVKALRSTIGCAEKRRHEDKAPPVELLEQLQVRFVEIDQRGGHADHADPGQDVDEKQPVPRQPVGEIAPDGRADGRRQGGNQSDHRHDDRHARAWKHRIGGRKHGRNHAAADEALDGAPEDHLVHRARQSAHQARKREAGGGAGEHPAGTERARQKAGQRDRDDLRDQISRLHP
jgi:hypothetical protein